MKSKARAHAFCTASPVVEPNEKVSEIFAKIAANQIILSNDDSTKVSYVHFHCSSLSSSTSTSERIDT